MGRGQDRKDDRQQRLLWAMKSAGGLDELDDAQLEVLEDLVKDVRRQRSRSEPRSLPRRALALDAVDTLGVPASPRLISWVVEARTGDVFEARALAAARRDDRVSWDRERDAGRTPTPKLAPALHHELLEPMRALVTTSTWSLPQRIVTPHSVRADHPVALLAILDEAERLETVDPDASARLTQLAGRLAVGLPGAGHLKTTDPKVRSGLRAVATEEYERFGAESADERQAAARRAEMIDPIDRVWGRRSGEPLRRRTQGR